ALGTGAQNPRFDDNRYGGQVGGPIVKNKLFYFGDFEYRTLGRASVPAGGTCAPTAAGYATLSSMTGISATNLGVLQKYATSTSGLPCPNGNAVAVTNSSGGTTPIPVGLLPIQAPNFTNFKYLTTAMDYDISAKDQLRGRYIYNSAVGIDASANLPAFFLSAPTKFHLASLAEYHTFNPSLSNELRVAFNRFDNTTPAGNFQFPGLDSFPNLIFFDLNLQLG